MKLAFVRQSNQFTFFFLKWSTHMTLNPYSAGWSCRGENLRASLTDATTHALTLLQARTHTRFAPLTYAHTRIQSLPKTEYESSNVNYKSFFFAASVQTVAKQSTPTNKLSGGSPQQLSAQLTYFPLPFQLTKNVLKFSVNLETVTHRWTERKWSCFKFWNFRLLDTLLLNLNTAKCLLGRFSPTLSWCLIIEDQLYFGQF